MKRTTLAIAIGALSAGISIGSMAQESGQQSQGQQTQQGQMGQQQGQGQQGQEQQGQQGQGQQDQQNSLMSMQASELEGKQVVTQQGEEIGEIEQISKSTQDNQLYAIVSVGGFLGIGDTSVALPLQDMEVQEDQILLKTDRSEEELKQSADEYQEDNYQEVDDNTTLSEAASQGSS